MRTDLTCSLLGHNLLQGGPLLCEKIELSRNENAALRLRMPMAPFLNNHIGLRLRRRHGRDDELHFCSSFFFFAERVERIKRPNRLARRSRKRSKQPLSITGNSNLDLLASKPTPQRGSAGGFRRILECSRSTEPCHQKSTTAATYGI